MSKPMVTIIDHDNYDKPTNRRTTLKDKITRQGYVVNDYPFIWGNEVMDNPECSPASFAKVSNVNLVHSNNTCSSEFIEYVLTEFPNAWIVEYSGGGIEAMNHRQPAGPRHCIYPNAVTPISGIPRLANFLDAVAQGQENACDILKGFDPVLEAKLELLHICLTPEGARRLLRVGDESKEVDGTNRFGRLKTNIETEALRFDSTDIEADWGNGHDSAKEFRGNLNAAINKLAEPHQDCFSPEYIAILCAIRDALLTSS